MPCHGEATWHPLMPLVRFESITSSLLPRSNLGPTLAWALDTSGDPEGPLGAPPARAPAEPELARESLSQGFFPYDVSETRAATCTGFTSPGCAAPSGFLSLLTLCSALARTALFHAESVHGVEALRGFPLPVAATAFAARCPFSPVPTRRPGTGSRIHAPGRSVHRGASFTQLRGPILSRPLSPSEDFSPRALASLTEGLLSWASSRRQAFARRRDRSPECQRTRGLACLFREPPPSLGFVL